MSPAERETSVVAGVTDFAVIVSDRVDPLPQGSGMLVCVEVGCDLCVVHVFGSIDTSI